MIKSKIVIFIALATFQLGYAQKAAEQISIRLVDAMPNMPTPYKMKDWKKVTAQQDSLLYDFNAKGPLLPLIWWDDNKVNVPIRSFGIPSYVGASRNMNKQSSYESLPVIGSVLGASLVGIDKSNYNGIDFVSMCRQFYNTKNGENLVMNSVDRKTGETFWYDIFPGMAFNMLVDQYPKKKEIADIMKLNADKWIVCINRLSKEKKYPDFNFTAFDFKTNKGVYNGVWHEPDAAAGLAWLEFTAWKKWGDASYLQASKSCMDYLQNRPEKEGAYYEIMMPYGAYMAVRMNAELGTKYDEIKLLNWCFDGQNSDRNGWGVMAEKWGQYDVDGLVGQKKEEQYAFAMNTFSQAAALVPIVKYNPSYSKTIGKWILNLSNSSRLFYSDEHPKNRQTSAVWQGDPNHVICYEGLRKDLDHGNGFEVYKDVLANEGPYALGDQMKQYSSATDLCPYGSAWVGMLASIVDTTNVEGILKINCNATDFFSSRALPTFLFYNPYKEIKNVSFNVGNSSVNIYDSVSKKYIGRKVIGNFNFKLNANTAMTLIIVPSEIKTSMKNKTLIAGTNIIDYHY
ncbi:hypothetical protein EKL99_02315 [Flavobacterium sp. ZB4P23]|uniref:hypothetical protein n=1 Tax=Flavobacterium sp. ZB4P23 TaxID=2497484 RepID=UPI000F849AF2|nr:hypothetical protein [Flavobacterium sp. ZB4P23]RTY84843.1 hypothetical protein EKL99_02315 [Flavobacterium sp. ZB4P23]